MSIVAPDPASSLRQGFPDPSPAASGKRKLAELAAAQMLAGVAASGTKEARIDGDCTPPPRDADVMTGSAPRGVGLSLQIVNPESLGVTYSASRKGGRGGEPSPTTPWDGQLEQLVRYVAKCFIDVFCNENLFLIRMKFTVKIRRKNCWRKLLRISPLMTH